MGFRRGQLEKRIICFHVYKLAFPPLTVPRRGLLFFLLPVFHPPRDPGMESPVVQRHLIEGGGATGWTRVTGMR